MLYTIVYRCAHQQPFSSYKTKGDVGSWSALLLAACSRVPHMCCSVACRRRPRLGADGWFRGAGGQQGDLQQHEPGFLHSLSDFLDTMASGMAALGLFAQVRSQALFGSSVPGCLQTQPLVWIKGGGG